MRITVIKEPKGTKRPQWIPALINNINARFGECTSSKEFLMETIPEVIRDFQFLRRNNKYPLSGIVRVETDIDKGLVWVIHHAKDNPVLTFQID